MQPEIKFLSTFSVTKIRNICVILTLHDILFYFTDFCLKNLIFTNNHGCDKKIIISNLWQEVQRYHIKTKSSN